MRQNDASLYSAFKAKDARFDGCFFVGVTSTGIYCRPVCRARMPLFENCRFFSCAAEAEQAGYRPCLLCRPERAPGTPATRCDSRPAYTAARILEGGCTSGMRIRDVAGQVGCSERQLRRLFAAEYGVSPTQFLQTSRLLLAKSLLVETDLSVLDVAMAAGFGSLRRFNDLFRNRYRLTPTALRRQRGADKQQPDGLVVSLAYRPPYPWEHMLAFLAARAIGGVEKVEQGEYARTVRLTTDHGHEACGWLRVANLPDDGLLSVTVSEGLLPVIPEVLARVKRLFDVRCDPAAIYDVLHVMNRIRPGLCVLGTRVPGCFDTFEMATRAVLGQQVTVKAASTLARRVAQACGTPTDTGIDGLTHLFPSPEDLLAKQAPLEDRLGVLGITSARSRSIYELARAVINHEIELGLSVCPEEETRKLTGIKGIGNWTAQYIALRAMEWPDAFMETDVGIRRALAPRSPHEILALSQAWRPWRSYATLSLWNSLEQAVDKPDTQHYAQTRRHA
ncbi:MAG: helix-turn-helix domain-containing protein [Coriobacteriales bacterium]|jgi:AraC family transcriptional regulator of adaptative response / DNA-3-methyladenine glycosylase II|nr:helix-turn-helix domain-containing protein [Coriobacteriales bacterium]